MPQIIIEIRGGVLEAVFTDLQALRVTVVDHDSLACLEHDPEELPDLSGLTQVY